MLLIATTCSFSNLSNIKMPTLPTFFKAIAEKLECSTTNPESLNI